MRRSSLLLPPALIVLLLLLLPSLVIVPVSLTDTSYLALPRDGLSLQHWRAVLAEPRWRGGMETSLVIGLSATVLATTVGALFALGCWRLSSRLGEIARFLALLPLIVPPIIYALALYRLYAALALLDSYVGVILAHAVLGLPYVVITVGAALGNFDRRLDQAARSLGASGGQRLWLVLLPNIRGGVLAGAFFAFVNSWDELIVVLFIASRHIRTLPREIWSSVRESLDPAIAAVAVLLTAVTLLGLVPALRAAGRPAPSGS